MEISGSVEMTEPLNQTITSEGHTFKNKPKDGIVASPNEIEQRTEEQEKPTEHSKLEYEPFKLVAPHQRNACLVGPSHNIIELKNRLMLEERKQLNTVSCKRRSVVHGFH